MGISNLLPFVKDATRQANVSEFRGKTVGVDASCWIHKALFGCADLIALGRHTEMYVNYCLKLVTLLLRHNMDVLLVFDGASLPAKHETNKTRRERRQTMKEKGKLLFEQGFVDKARGCFQQSSEIEFYMIVDIINACKKFPGVRYIVSPYEADAQLAYLSLNDHVQLVISEDSDLIPFGCYSVLYKMDLNGNGILYERRSLPEALNIPPDKFDFAAFRRMCIMAGCDYLSSLPGIGIRKSAKFFAKTTEQDLTKVLPKIPKYLGMKKVTVTDEYISRFIEAENTFLYQIVFDPVKRKMVPLTPYPNGFTDDSFPYAGKLLAVDVACDLADGNIHPHSHERSETHLIKSTMTATLQSSQSHHAESNRERRNKKFAFEVSGSRSVNKMEPLIQKNEGGRNLKLTSESHKEYLITNKGKFSEICEPAATFVSSYFVSGDASSSSTFLQYVAKEGRDSIPDKADALKNEELDVINEEGNRSFSPSSCWSLLKIEEKKKSSKETLPVLSRNPFKIKSPMTSNSEKQDSCVESNDLPASRLVSVSSIDVLMDDVDADESCSFNSPSPCTAVKDKLSKFHFPPKSSQSGSSMPTLKQFFPQTAVGKRTAKRPSPSNDADCELIKVRESAKAQTKLEGCSPAAPPQVTNKCCKTKSLGLSKRKRVPSLHVVRKVKTDQDIKVRESFRHFMYHSQS